MVNCTEPIKYIVSKFTTPSRANFFSPLTKRRIRQRVNAALLSFFE